MAKNFDTIDQLMSYVYDQVEQVIFLLSKYFDLIKVYRENGIRYYKFLISRGIKLAIKEFKNK